MSQMGLDFGTTGSDAAEAGDVQQRMDRLVDELNRHNHLYHVLDSAEIDDRSYDMLFRELEELE